MFLAPRWEGESGTVTRGLRKQGTGVPRKVVTTGNLRTKNDCQSRFCIRVSRASSPSRGCDFVVGVPCAHRVTSVWVVVGVRMEKTKKGCWKKTVRGWKSDGWLLLPVGGGRERERGRVNDGVCVTRKVFFGPPSRRQAEGEREGGAGGGTTWRARPRPRTWPD